MNQTILNSPTDIILFNNNTLYIADSSYRVLAFQPNTRTAQIVNTFDSYIQHFFYHNKSSNFYGSISNEHIVYIWPSNTTIPPNGLRQGNCSFNKLFYPTGVAVDSFGNVYISSF